MSSRTHAAATERPDDGTALDPGALGWSENRLAMVAAAIGCDSDLIRAAARVRKRPDNVLRMLVRALSREEIAIMEGRGCRADDWSCVRVAEDFDPFRVRRTHFVGPCVLGRFDGEVEVEPGISLPTGVYGCTLIACQVGNNALMENVRFAAHCVIDREAVIFDVGSITASGEALFGCGQTLGLCLETGGRELPLWAEVRVDAAAQVCRFRTDSEGQDAVRAAVERYVAAIRSPVAWVCRSAVVRHTDKVRDCYIGPGARVDHALGLENAALLSSREEPTVVEGGASVRDAVLQWGVRVSGNAIVRNAALLEHSGADENGIIEQSLIGPNSSIARGEVTACLVGPFVGFHHQSLLIAAFWPAGKGNIAYGAMVGSNHTGRSPDQEIWPGEGTFFGLGCSIRFPSDFSRSPYSLFAAGVSTLPQRLCMPFSLISTPVEPLDEESDASVPRAFNELSPGWALYANAYGLERIEMKLAARDRSRRHRIRYQVLRPEVMAQVREALERLESVTTRHPVYLEQDIDGLGKNFLREESRQQGIAAYRRVLQRYALRILLGEAEGSLTISGSAEIAHELLGWLMPDSDFAARMEALVEIERDNARIVERSRAKDTARGQRVIEGYCGTHPPVAEDPVVQSAWRRVERTGERIAAVLRERPAGGCGR